MILGIWAFLVSRSLSLLPAIRTPHDLLWQSVDLGFRRFHQLPGVVEHHVPRLLQVMPRQAIASMQPPGIVAPQSCMSRGEAHLIVMRGGVLGLFVGCLSSEESQDSPLHGSIARCIGAKEKSADGSLVEGFSLLAHDVSPLNRKEGS